MPRAGLVILFASISASCSGEPPPDEEVACAEPGSVELQGEVDGEPIDEKLDGIDFADDQGRLEITFSASGVDRLVFEYPGGSLEPGGSVPARGFIDLAASGGLAAGNCDLEGFYSTLARDEDGVSGTFVLRGLRAKPFCTGRDLEGTLTGCFRAPSP